MMTSRSTERMEAKFKEGMCVKKKKRCGNPACVLKERIDKQIAMLTSTTCVEKPAWDIWRPNAVPFLLVPRMRANNELRGR